MYQSPLEKGFPMNFEATLETITQYLPEDLDKLTAAAAAFIPRDLAKVMDHAASYIPAKVDFITTVQFIVYFTLASLVLGLLGRVVLGKRSSLNLSVSSAIGILFIYVLTVIVYTFNPWQLQSLMTPLPFVSFFKDYLIVFPITNTMLTPLCSEILSLIILAFLVNLTDTFLPRGNNPVTWYLMRFTSVAGSMALHYFVRKALHMYLPQGLITYAPAIMLFLLAFMLLSGIINLVLGLFIAVTNPFLGAMYTFFFSNIVGKQLSKAIFSTAILCCVVYMVEYFGYTLICITSSALATYIPFVAVLLVLWYIVGHLL